MSVDIVLIFYNSLGGENLAVAQNTYAVTWFKEKELNMVFGLQLSFSRVVSVIMSDHNTRMLFYR